MVARGCVERGRLETGGVSGPRLRDSPGVIEADRFTTTFRLDGGALTVAPAPTGQCTVMSERTASLQISATDEAAGFQQLGLATDW